MPFMNMKHKERAQQCINRDNTDPYDYERRAMFYILSGSNDLWNKGIDNFYDFNEHYIKPSSVKGRNKAQLSRGSSKLVQLAFNLYNGFTSKSDAADIVSTFASLDDENFALALNAIKIRFQKN